MWCKRQSEKAHAPPAFEIDGSVQRRSQVALQYIDHVLILAYAHDRPGVGYCCFGWSSRLLLVLPELTDAGQCGINTGYCDLKWRALPSAEGWGCRPLQPPAPTPCRVYPSRSNADRIDTKNNAAATGGHLRAWYVGATDYYSCKNVNSLRKDCRRRWGH